MSATIIPFVPRSTNTGLPKIEGGFRVIAADPPWNFKVRSDKGEGRAAPYQRMSIKDICAMPVASVAARDCHLFLWVTGPHLEFAFEVMRAWGFKYSGVAFTWIKLKRSLATALAMFLLKVSESRLSRMPLGAFIETLLHCGMGYTTRKNAEFCLIGRRGSPKRLAKDVREVIVSPVREHSRKPDEFYQRVERYAEGPRLELFARTRRAGWEAWGNEVDKFQAVEAA